MILNIRGTSGSGKSTLARAIMALYHPGVKERFYKEGRRQPYFYKLTPPDLSRPSLYVLGHYETACGGTDTITSMDDIFALASKLDEPYAHVLMEGLLISGESRRIIELHKRHHVEVLVLNTPLELCLANIQQRRTARGNDKPINPKNTTSKYKSVLYLNDKLKAEGMSLTIGDYATLLSKARELLNV